MQAEMNQTQPRPQRFSQVVNRLCLGFSVIMIFAFVGVNGMSLVTGDWMYENTWAQLVVNDVFAYLVGLPLAMLIFRTVRNQKNLPVKPKHPVSLPFFAFFTVFLFGLSYLVNIATMGVLYVLDVPGQTGAEDLMMELGPVASVLLVALAPALIEEFIFRGLMYKCLAPFGEKPYVLLSGLFFGMFHGNLSQLPYAFAIGCCFALLCYRTGTMVYGMMLHFLFNYTSACVFAPFLEDMAANTIMGMWMIFTIICSLVFAGVYRKGMKLTPGQNLGKHPVVSALLNPGALTFEILIVLMIVLAAVTAEMV